MWNWVRKIPTFCYGNYGGGYRSRTKLPPKDWLDKACKDHDAALKAAITKSDFDDADQKFGIAVRSGDIKKLGWWGKVFRRGTMLFF